MNPVSLSAWDLAIAASLVLVDIVLSIALRLGLHRQIAIASVRMVIQLVAVGFVLRFVFALKHPAATLAILLMMLLIATREVAARPARRLSGGGNLLISLTGVVLATVVTALLALTTAVRPTPWYDPRYAIALTGIILGTVLNSGSIALDAILTDFPNHRAAIEARLALGEPFKVAARPLVASAIRLGILPVINQMAASGIVTLPGIMTGQILAGMDPMEAVKYQILLMFLLAGSGGLTAVCVTALAASRLTDERERLRLDRLR